MRWASTVSVLVLPLVLGSASCGSNVLIRPDEIPQLVPRLQTVAATNPSNLTDPVSGKTYTVTSGDDLELVVELDRSCSLWQRLDWDCDAVVSSPIRLVKVEGEQLTLQRKGCVFCGREPLNARLDEVKSARLVVGSDADLWRPIFGVGLTVAGPSGGAAVGVHVLPWSWLGLELGTLPAADMLLFYGAFKIRPTAHWSLKPFLGGFFHVGSFFDPSDGDHQHILATGPRLGLDLELVRGHWLLTAEFNLVHPLQEDRRFYVVFEDHGGNWLGWWGVGVTYFL